MQLFILPTDTCFWIATPIKDIDWYKTIYKIKNRELSKPLAILVDSFEWLEKNTTLNQEQIDFLKKYDRPFTILTQSKTDILPKNLPNKQIYQKLAFRVAHNFMHSKLIRLNNSPLFLTSANRSWECELFSSHNIREIFENEIKENNINVFAHPGFCINSKQNSSDIFEFIWDTTEIKYIRQN
jgi:tRNA A37 threonylcarbamoyladenosine synthetase subunit TsaC/SUA5/YrdC